MIGLTIKHCNRMRMLKMVLSLTLLLCTVTAAEAQKRDPDALLKQAIRETNVNQNYPRAIELAQQGLAISPGYIDIRLLLGRLYILTGKPDDARSELNKVLMKQPGNIDALNYLINLESGAGDDKQALFYIDQVVRINPGSKELLAKKAAILQAGKQYAAAYTITDNLLKTDTGNRRLKQMSADLHDAAGNALLKKGQLDAARNEFLIALKMTPRDEDALIYLTNLESEQRHYKEALYYNDRALIDTPASKNLLLKKEYFLDLLNQPYQAYQVVERLSVQYPDDPKIKKIKRDLYSRSRQNRIAVNYDLTAFNRPNVGPWNLLSLYYQRDGTFGSIVGRVSYANRLINISGVQYELEAYPRFHNGDYSDADVAYSPSIVFPKFRAAYSYFKEFHKGWEAELGLRYQQNPGGSFVSYAVSGSKYIGAYWINLRAFITPDSGKVAQAYTLTGRYYFQSKDDYFTIIAGTGISPDDRSNNFQFNNRVNLSSNHISVGYQRTVWQRHIIGILGTVNNQEYIAGKKEDQYDVFLSYQLKF